MTNGDLLELWSRSHDDRRVARTLRRMRLLLQQEVISMKQHISDGHRKESFPHRNIHWGMSAARHQACMGCGKAIGDDDLHWHTLIGRCAECGLELP